MAYSSYSYSSGGYGGADAAFNAADANHDGRVDLGEFRSFLGQNVGAGGGYGGSAYESSSYGVGGGAGFGGSSYESYESSGAGLGAGYGAGYGASVGLGGGYGGSSYESSSYGVSGGAGFGGAAGFGGGAGFGGAAGFGGGAYDSVSSSGAGVQQYATDAQGLFIDNNPQIIRRPAAGGVQTYTQNIRVKFLQPPPVPPPGPLIIKEVRPPQPPPPPPLRIRQQAPPLPSPPPLVLRERPPQPPLSVASQTVIRRLGALPVPPRSVIIERLPPLPPRPRDVIIERWIPYGAQAKRRTIVQRAGAAQQYAAPKNVIIQYEPVQVRVVRQFQNLGVTPGSPSAYLQQYGASLLDAGSLVSQARAAGVVEDLSPPGGFAAAAVGFGAGSYGQEAYGVSGGLVGGAVGVDAGFGLGGGYGSSSYESSSYSSGGLGGGLGGGLVAGGSYGLGGGYGGSSSWESSSSYGVGGGYGGADAAFAAADVNQDGRVDLGEFRHFVGSHLGGAAY